MGKFLESFTMQAGQGIAGGLLGMALGGLQDARQVRQQERLQNLQIKGSKEMADYNLKKQLELWNATNYSAQKEQMEKAGLNPALLYGMSGGGGATTAANTGQVSGATAQGHGGEAIAMAQQFAQLGLMKAQRENIEADTANKNADTTKKAGVDTQEAQTRIQNLLQGINNQKAQEALTKVETRIAAVNAEVAEYSVEDFKDKIVYEVDKIKQELMVAQNETFISRATMNAKVDIIRAGVVEATLKNGLLASNIKLNDAQISKWANEIAIGWEQLSVQEQQLRLNALKTEMEINNPNLWNKIGGMLQETLDELSQMAGDLRTGYKKVPIK